MVGARKATEREGGMSRLQRVAIGFVGSVSVANRMDASCSFGRREVDQESSSAARDGGDARSSWLTESMAGGIFSCQMRRRIISRVWTRSVKNWPICRKERCGKGADMGEGKREKMVK